MFTRWPGKQYDFYRLCPKFSDTGPDPPPTATFRRRLPPPPPLPSSRSKLVLLRHCFDPAAPRTRPKASSPQARAAADKSGINQESDRSLPLRKRDVVGWEHDGDHSSMELSKSSAYVDDLMALNITSHQLMSCVLRVRVSLYILSSLLWRGSDSRGESDEAHDSMSVDYFTY